MPRLLEVLSLLGCLLPLQGRAEEATPADRIAIREGFAVERVLSVPRELGSWVAFCFDDRGRIYASDQGPRLFRITPPAGAGEETLVETVSDAWGHSQGMTFLDGALYLMQHGDHAPERFRPDRLLRIRDTDGDDRLDSADTLVEFPRVEGDAANWYEHGYHAVIPGPDGKSLWFVSGDRNALPCDRVRTPKLWNRDSWDHPFVATPHAGGWVARSDLDGGNMEVVCMGLRNCYDLAFDRQGDLFTFDSDLENDFGLPEYRPTAIRQIVSGGDHGWGGRAGEMLWNWPPAWEEIQAPLVDIGPGSPTGICFGHGAAFPPRYREALFACDWSYGRLFAIHLAPHGATHRAEAEPFLSAQGLPIADVAVSPRDGALWFLTGGRGTQSGLYRVTAVEPSATAGAPPSAPDESPSPPDPEATAARARRLALEAFHGGEHPEAVEAVWPSLDDDDRAIRAAARAALEWQPVDRWQARALAEPRASEALEALLALARATAGRRDVQEAILARLARFDFEALPPREQALVLRILTVSASRHGRFSPAAAEAILARVEPALPSADREVNVAAVALAAGLGSRTFLEKALALLEGARTQEEQIGYVRALVGSASSAPWTPALRGRFLDVALDTIPRWKGGFTARAVRDSMLHRTIEMLPPEERAAHAAAIEAARKPAPALPATKRTLVRAWTAADLDGDLADVVRRAERGEGDAGNGRRLFAEGACLVCHGFRGEGGRAGPDLTTAARRYTPRDLLVNILDPSRVINEQYALNVYRLADGTTFTGRTVNMAGDTVMVATDPNDPGGSEVRFQVGNLEETTPSRVSFMPQGLLDTFTADEILDLLAWLRSE